MFHRACFGLGCRHVILTHCSLTGIFFEMYLFLIAIYESLEKHTLDCFSFTCCSEWWWLGHAHLGICVHAVKCRQPHTSIDQVQNNQVQIISWPNPECCYSQVLPMLLSPAPGYTSHRARLILESVESVCQTGETDEGNIFALWQVVNNTYLLQTQVSVTAANINSLGWL